MTNTATKDALQEYINSLPISYSAEFVPQSKSRNKGKKYPCLNWKVKFTRSIAASFETDYMQGIAHARGYEHSLQQSGWKNRYFAQVAEAGKTLNVLPRFSNKNVDWYEANDRLGRFSMGTGYSKPLTPPDIKDVLYSLIMDYSVLDHDSFESWADNFGYEKDSRSAEKTYNDCMSIALKLKALLGAKAIEKLQELYSDY